MAVLASTDINAFHVIGAVLALWAVVLSVLGVMRHEFPAKGGQERVVIAISGLLVIAAITAAIASSGEEEPKGSEANEAANKAGKEGSQTPGGTPAPEQESGQGSSTQKDQNAPSGQAAQTLTLTADPSGKLAFDKTALSAKAGTVRIVANNPAPVEHNVSITGNGVNKQGPTVQKGGTSQVTVKLKAGSYTFYCSVPGHRQAGMQGTLTVK